MVDFTQQNTSPGFVPFGTAPAGGVTPQSIDWVRCFNKSPIRQCRLYLA